MANTAGNAYGLTALIPLKKGSSDGVSYDKQARDLLQQWPKDDESPMACVPNTYLCRFYLLNDVFYEGEPAVEEHLKNKYIAYETNFYGSLEFYLTEAWEQAKATWQNLLKHCVAFDEVKTSEDFVCYIKRCQVNNHLYFNGSNDKPLAEQLKSLFVKQSFSHFCFLTQEFQAQGELGARRLQEAFRRYNEYIDADNLQHPTWPVAANKEPENISGDIAHIVAETKEAVQ